MGNFICPEQRGGKEEGSLVFLSKYLSLCCCIGQFCLLISNSPNHSGSSFFSYLHCMLAFIQICLFLVCYVCSTQLRSTCLFVPAAAAIMGHADFPAIGTQKTESNHLALKASAQIEYVSQLFIYLWAKPVTWSNLVNVYSFRGIKWLWIFVINKTKSQSIILLYNIYCWRKTCLASLLELNLPSLPSIFLLCHHLSVYLVFFFPLWDLSIGLNQG